MKKKYLSASIAVVLAGLSLNIQAEEINPQGFIEDSKISLTARNFYINTDTSGNGLPAVQKREWGQGFVLNLVSGYTPGMVGFGAEALGLLGIKLDSSPSRHGNPTGAASGGTIFPSKGNRAADQFSSLGVTGKIKVSDTELKIGTLLPENPVVQYNYGRLLPQTFHGGELTANEIQGLKLTLGKLEGAKGRNSSNVEGLSIGGANAGSDYARGKFSNKFYYGGIDYDFTDDLTASYYYGNLKNFYQQHFLGLVHELPIGPGSLSSDFRYFHSRDDGANSHNAAYYTNGYYGNGVTKGKVDNNLLSGLFLYNVAGHTFGGGYQYTNGKSDFPWINQGDGSANYTITNMQIDGFVRAGERSWLMNYGYDFAELGLSGLTANFVYVSGSNIRHPSGSKSEWERNLTLSYVIPDGMLKNLGFTWKNATWRSNIPDTRNREDDNRILVSYTYNFL